MTPPKDPIGRIIQNALNLQRVSNALTQDSTDILRALFDELAADIARIDPTAPSAVRYRRDRVERLLERAAKLIADAMGDVHKGARQDLARLGRQQGEWAAQQLVVSLGPAGVRVAFRGPSVNTMKAILDVNPFQGETLRGWAKVQEAALLRRVRQQIQLGMANEESIDQLVRRVRGTSDGRGGFRGGVLEALSLIHI